MVATYSREPEVPNAADDGQAGLARAHQIGFGDTINVINGAQECGKGGGSEESRAAVFLELIHTLIL